MMQPVQQQYSSINILEKLDSYCSNKDGLSN